MEPVSAIESLIGPLHTIISMIQFLIGGVFGIYLLMLVYNWFKTRKLYEEIKVIRKDIQEVKSLLKKKTRKRK